MYSYSHEPDAAWLGQFQRPSEALIAGRAMYGEGQTIYVCKWSQAHYTDLFIGAQALLSYMREDGTERMSDEDLAAFDALNADRMALLDEYLRDTIGEWEAELPKEMQFTGVWIEHTKAYQQGEEVRPGHFPAPL